MPANFEALASVIEQSEKDLLSRWIAALTAAGATRSGQTSDKELKDACGRFLKELRNALKSGAGEDIASPPWQDVREVLEEISTARALRGYSPVETALFVFSLKEPLFDLLRKVLAREEHLADVLIASGGVLDRLGLFTTEVYQKSREEVIKRQQDELLELSTPVIQLWDKILALPLIGTLDSARTQIVMENLLQTIVDAEAEIAIIDITGVPAVDTLVAQHLIKTVAAARLMGADCIISGIRPQIAQTIVHLGLDLQVVSKATMADALSLALKKTGQRVERLAARG
ncbi:STAS domain-containing protein [Methylocystis sp. H62]|uniref:STAS domain-containing protein n=1 Tax=Methylocystis sp. H62 TaxID=2785789 RepID=UPI0018C251D7|nr:STAS domain-containing protein [Methylocystis sp. H62]MBG0792057.1 STAS domain-containing protein [Methylocystis sp. H62]